MNPAAAMRRGVWGHSASGSRRGRGTHVLGGWDHVHGCGGEQRVKKKTCRFQRATHGDARARAEQVKLFFFFEKKIIRARATVQRTSSVL